MAWTERYLDSASSGGDGTTNATSGANAAWADFGAAISGVASGQRVNVKAGTYANTTTSRTFSVAGTTTAPIWWRGYKTTIGDQDTNNVAVAGTDIPTVTSTTGQFIVNGAHEIFSNLDFSGATTTAGGLVFINTGTDITLYRCRFTNTAANSASKALTFGGSSVNCIAAFCYCTATSSTPSVSTSGASIRLHACVMAAAGGGIIASSGFLGVSFCIFDLNAGDAIATSGFGSVQNCSFYGKSSGGGNGINVTAINASGLLIANCYFENVATAAKTAITNSSGTNTNRIRLIGNAFFGCTANIAGLGDSPVIYDLGTLAGAGFNAGATHDFSATTYLKAIGYPGTFENTSVYQGYLDVGAVQRQEPTSGGGVSASRIFTGR